MPSVECYLLFILQLFCDLLIYFVNDQLSAD